MLCMQDGEGMSVAGAGPGKLTGLLVPPDLTLTYCLFLLCPSSLGAGRCATASAWLVHSAACLLACPALP